MRGACPSLNPPSSRMEITIEPAHSAAAVRDYCRPTDQPVAHLIIGNQTGLDQPTRPWGLQGMVEVTGGLASLFGCPPWVGVALLRRASCRSPRRGEAQEGYARLKVAVPSSPTPVGSRRGRPDGTGHHWRGRTSVPPPSRSSTTAKTSSAGAGSPPTAMATRRCRPPAANTRTGSALVAAAEVRLDREAAA